MAVDRLRPAHRPDDRELAKGVVEMIVAADDMGDAHVVIVDHHGEHIGRAAVRAEQDEIVDLAILDRDPALDLVVDDRLALARRLQPHRRRGHRAPARRARYPATGCGCGTGGARPAPPRAARPAPRRSSSSDRRGRRRADRARPRHGAPHIRTGNAPRRPSRGRASASRRGSRRSPAGSSAPCRYPRCAAGTCRRDGARRAS